jgi:hypothetical protein
MRGFVAKGIYLVILGVANIMWWELGNVWRFNQLIDSRIAEAPSWYCL